MKILIRGSIVFLLWLVFAGWIYVSRIKPVFTTVQEPTQAPDTATLKVLSAMAQAEPEPAAILIFFDFAKAEINNSSAYDERVKDLSGWLKKHPASGLKVTGHTDSRGTEDYNLRLGSLRALSAEKYLTSMGIEAGRITASSEGELKPVASNSTLEGRAGNRRVEITIK